MSKTSFQAANPGVSEDLSGSGRSRESFPPAGLELV